MNIVFITREEFPYGAAATNRILSYVPGLAKKGHKITILCLFLSSKENAKLLDSKSTCIYEGVEIRYMQGRTVWPVGQKRFLKKAYLMFKARVMSVMYLIRNRKSINLVQVYASQIDLYYRYAKWCKRLGIKYVLERSELPDIVKEKERFVRSKEGQKYIRLTEKSYNLFDGWILETQNLVDYYGRFFSPQAKWVIVPMTVDVNRFNKEKQFDSRYGQYIAYCGNMGELDGISILIKAFALMHPRFPNVKLVLAGHSDQVPTQKQLAESLGVKDEVLFIGRLSRDEVPQFLANATILALASPTSERACATMPCKVGEYLCTENPVVVTGLGEINKYLKDGESAFLARPDSAEAFAEKLEEVLTDYDAAKLVGHKGREIATANFSTEAQVNRIENFYKDLINR